MKLRKRRQQTFEALHLNPFEEAQLFCNLGKDQEGFNIKHINSAVGAGVFTTKPFDAGAFLLQYRGELISYKEGLRRERSYAACKGSFLFFFKDRQHKMCIDATESTGSGRMVNDAHCHPIVNCKVMVFHGCADDRPRLCLFAIRDIIIGEELRFDYGVPDLPWRRKDWRPYPDMKISEEVAQSELQKLSFCGLQIEQPAIASHEEQAAGASHEEQTASARQDESNKSDDELESHQSDDEAESGQSNKENCQSECSGSDDEPESKKSDDELESHRSDDEAESGQSNEENCQSGRSGCSGSDDEPESNISDDELESDQSDDDESGQSNDEGSHSGRCGSSGESEIFPLLPGLATRKSLYMNEDHGSSSSEDDGKSLSSAPHEKKAVHKQKPSRPCAYCGEMQTQLLRHLKRKHKKEEAVKAAFKLPRPERIRAVAGIRKEGIYQENIRRVATNGKLEILSQRDQGTDRKVLCSGCRGFYSRHRIWKHKQNCTDSTIKHSSISVSSFIVMQNSSEDKKFSEDILCRFRDDSVGKLCQTDNLIVKLGKKLWSKSYRRDKHVIMNDMRRIGNLLQKLRSVSEIENLSGADMIKRHNFPHLETAIEELTKKDDHTIKAGLKLSLGYLLKTAAKVMKANYIIEGQLGEAEEVDHFLSVLDLNWGFMFGRSLAVVESKRQAVLRKPMAMPLEDDVAKLKAFTVESMQEITNDVYLKWDSHVFKTMRSLIVSRLTLFNARRGGEPSRLTLTEWKDAENEAWVDPQMVLSVEDPLERCLLNSYKLAYQSGKGSKKLVPCLIPKDTVAPIRALVANRGEAGVSPQNVFLFPFTQKSLDHVHGWACIKEVVEALGDKLRKPHLITATKFRHRASTLYAILDVPQNERGVFYKHMGHSEEINQNVYQCPLAIKEITAVAPYLASIDGSSASTGHGKKGNIKVHQQRSSSVRDKVFHRKIFLTKLNH